MGKKYIDFFKNFIGNKKDTAEDGNKTEEEKNVENVGNEEAKQKTSEKNGINHKNDASDPLRILYDDWCIKSGRSITSKNISDYIVEAICDMPEAQKYDFETNSKKFLLHFRLLANKRLVEMKKSIEMIEKKKESDPETQEDTTYSVDFEIAVHFAPKGIAAFIGVLPPIGDGKAVDYDSIMNSLQNSGIKAGVREDIIHKIVDEQIYFSIFPVALGQFAVDGKNGSVVEYVPREIENLYNEDKHGNIDFKNLNRFVSVLKGDLICDIILPEDGEDGFDVKGNVIQAKKGKAASIPNGMNTVISDDGTKLLAGSDGHVTYQNGKFKVAKVMDIPGNVDLSVGNLNFPGDIVVRGDVLSGFEIRAEGDIVVGGMVEDSFLFSGGDVTISNGMNGNAKGEIHAKGSVRCTFLENTNIYAEGNIYVDSLVNCKVYCDKSVFVTTGMGVIIGGSVMAMKSVEANIIGSKANRKNEIILGTMPHVVNERDELEKNIKEIKNTLDSLEKNITYLKSVDELPQQKAGILKQFEAQHKIYSAKNVSLQEQLNEIEKQIGMADEAYVTCGVIYPPTRVDINNQSMNITQVTQNAKILLSAENEIYIVPFI